MLILLVSEKDFNNFFGRSTKNLQNNGGWGVGGGVGLTLSYMKITFSSLLYKELNYLQLTLLQPIYYLRYYILIELFVTQTACRLKETKN